MTYKRNSASIFSILIALLTLSISCRKQPYELNNVAGYVIGTEICNVNEEGNYWLVDLTYNSNTPQYGDTLVLDGTTYTNVVKVKGLDERLRKKDISVSFDFKTITSEKVITSGCSVAAPVTYRLKELFIINQFEIR